MNATPLWHEARRKRYPSLTKSAAFDVVVIGGGITGVTAAYLLKQQGRKVCLLERDRIGFVDTGLTTAHLTYVTDLRPAKLVRRFGADAASAGARRRDGPRSRISREIRLGCTLF